MCPDYRAVDHLKAGVAATAVVERFEHQLPQTGQRPAPELAVNRRPFAEMLVQIAPRDTRSRNPEYTIQNKAMVPGAPATPSASFDHERLKAAPLFVAHQTTDQGNLPKTRSEEHTSELQSQMRISD